MSKRAELFACRGCGYERDRSWNPGLCPACLRRWDIRTIRVATDRGVVVEDGEVVFIADIDATEMARIHIGGQLASIDNLLGGGVVDGRGVYLIAGAAGIGKSTLLLQVAQRIASQDRRVLYATAEETLPQVKQRCLRLGLDSDPRLMFVRENDLEHILASAREQEVQLLVVDSINTLAVRSTATGDDFEVGSASAVTTAMRALVDFSSEENVPCFIIGHVTKDGAAAGPNAAAHLADTVMFFSGIKGKAKRHVSIPIKE